MSQWLAYRGTGVADELLCQLPLPDPPQWRTFDGALQDVPPTFADPTQLASQTSAARRGRTYQAGDAEVEMVNAAMYLRRPLLVTGKPGTGKSSLAYSVAEELRLGPVLRWPITSRSSLQESLYRYDAIGRLQEANLRHLRAEQGHESMPEPDAGQYIRLGPLGTALLPTKRPRVLLIDELDKSDIDLPNDLLNIFEEGEYDIPELVRLPQEHGPVEVMTADGGPRVPIKHGHVRCNAFPIVIITSNGEREFPPAFLRRCLQLHVDQPGPDKLGRIVAAQLGHDALRDSGELIEHFLARRNKGELATDQLLNAVYLVFSGLRPPGESREQLADAVLPYLGGSAV